MDLFEAGTQGLGLALAAGMLGGVIAGLARDHKVLRGPLLLVVGLVAAYAFGESLSAEDHPAWPGWFVGAAAAVFAFAVVADVVEGAVTRAGEQGSVASLGAIGAILALAIAGISLTFLAPVSILVLLVLLWVAVGRRRRADRKHEGLRTLRR